MGLAQDKVVVVTGAASGMGRAGAELFAAEGAAHVYVVDLDEAGEDVAGGLGAATFVRCDVSDPGEVTALFDRAETPENTEGREGYVWFVGLDANASQAVLRANIRDFDRASFEARKRKIGEVAAAIARRYPTGKVTSEVSDVYGNISDSLGDDRRSVDLLMTALAELQIAPKVIPMRGGTDGAALSARGLPTPNFFTGAHNFHSRFEFLPVPAFETAYEVARRICLRAAEPA